MAYSQSPLIQESRALPRVELRPLLRQVYMWMTLAMLVTTGSAALLTQFLGAEGLFANPGLVLGAVVAQLALVLALSWGLQRMSVPVAQALFFVYAATVGVTISLVLAIYNGETVIAAFATTAVLFFVMTMTGLTTSLDLTRYRSYLVFGLLGLLVAMIVNMFLGSSIFELLISMFGVVLFTALTAYDTQKLQRMAADPQIAAGGTALMSKLAIMGALTLYLDFLNLFLFLLRLLGGARD